jgi:hypothetical protein
MEEKLTIIQKELLENLFYHQFIIPKTLSKFQKKAPDSLLIDIEENINNLETTLSIIKLLLRSLYSQSNNEKQKKEWYNSIKISYLYFTNRVDGFQTLIVKEEYDEWLKKLPAIYK